MLAYNADVCPVHKQAAPKHKAKRPKHFISPKKILSLVGATIIFGTFLAKDAKRDKLKELIDSIDASQSAYVSRLDSRRNYTETIEFRREFERSKGMFPPQISHDTSFDVFTMSDRPEIDWYSLNAIEAEKPSVDDLVYDVTHLAKTLPKDEQRKQTMTAVVAEWSEVTTGWQSAYHDAEELEGNTATKEGQSKMKDLNRRIYEVRGKYFKLWDHLKKQSGSILEEAAREREKAEASYQNWTIIFYVLYGLGWVVGAIGILMHAEEDIIEKLVED